MIDIKASHDVCCARIQLQPHRENERLGIHLTIDSRQNPLCQVSQWYVDIPKGAATEVHSNVLRKLGH